jgi:hypothetical protein
MKPKPIPIVLARKINGISIIVSITGTNSLSNTFEINIVTPH